MSIEDTDKFIINYNQTYELIEKVSDNEKRQELYNRLSYKYDLLKGEVTDRWMMRLMHITTISKSKKI